MRFAQLINVLSFVQHYYLCLRRTFRAKSCSLRTHVRVQFVFRK